MYEVRLVDGTNLTVEADGARHAGDPCMPEWVELFNGHDLVFFAPAESVLSVQKFGSPGSTYTEEVLDKALQVIHNERANVDRVWLTNGLLNLKRYMAGNKR